MRQIRLDLLQNVIITQRFAEQIVRIAHDGVFVFITSDLNAVVGDIKRQILLRRAIRKKGFEVRQRGDLHVLRLGNGDLLNVGIGKGKAIDQLAEFIAFHQLFSAIRNVFGKAIL